MSPLRRYLKMPLSLFSAAPDFSTPYRAARAQIGLSSAHCDAATQWGAIFKNQWHAGQIDIVQANIRAASISAALKAQMR